MGVEGEDAWLSTALVAALAVVVCVDIWAAVVASRAAQTLSANALRSVELANEMRWQLTRLTPGPGDLPPLEPSTAEALRRLGQDVMAYEQLVGSDAERTEWSRLATLTRALADAWSGGDEAAALTTASSASESAERLIVLSVPRRTRSAAIG